MHAPSRVGGVAALVAAATFVVGLAMFATVLVDYTTATEPRAAVAFLVDNRPALHLWNLLITIVFGIVLGHSIISLAEFPEQRKLVRDRPELWENAGEEPAARLVRPRSAPPPRSRPRSHGDERGRAGIRRGFR